MALFIDENNDHKQQNIMKPAEQSFGSGLRFSGSNPTTEKKKCNLISFEQKKSKMFEIMHFSFGQWTLKESFMATNVRSGYSA